MVKLSWKACFRLFFSLFLLYLLIHYWQSFSGVVITLLGASSALILGALIAYVVNIPMSFFELHLFPSHQSDRQRQLRRIACLLLAYFSVVAIAVLIIRLIVPELYSCTQLLIQEMPPYIDKLMDYINKNFDLTSIFGTSSSIFTGDDINWHDVVTKGLNLLATGFGGVMSSIFTLLSTVFSFAFSLLLGIIFSIYLLIDKDRIRIQLVRVMQAYIKPLWNERILYVIRVVSTCFHHFIVGQCTEAVILGALCMSGMALFKFPYATMIGALIGFSALVPIAGAYIGASIGAFMIFTISPIKALLFLVFIVLLQQFEGNFIYPKVVGASIGLPGIWVLAAITIGGGIAGIGGMVLGVPLAASFYHLLKADVRAREQLRCPAAPSPSPSDDKPQTEQQ